MLHVLMIVTIFINSAKLSSCQFNPNFFPNRSGIVHLFEWKFNDIASECEAYLSQFGFGGVQVSPINENAIVSKRPWFERYQPISYNIITRSGDESDFRNMVHRCNAVGVRIYVDIVANHMAAGNGFVNGTGGNSAFIPEKYYPGVPYNETHFHSTCAINDYNNAFEVRNCELVGLPDLDQSEEYVRGAIVDFMNTLIDFGVAGFRMDASKHMWPSDLNVIYSRLKNLSGSFASGSRPFIYQEVIDLGGEAVKKTEYMLMGAVTEFKFSLEICRAFRGHNQLKWLKSWGPQWDLLPPKYALVFVDNHDNQRGNGAGGSEILTYKVRKMYVMAVAFMLAHPYGIPRIMSSYSFEFSDQGFWKTISVISVFVNSKNSIPGPPSNSSSGDIISPIILPNGTCSNGWVCEHRWTEIAGMIGYRNNVRGELLVNWWDNGNNIIAFCRGNKGFIAINNEANETVFTANTCLSRGVYCDVISGTKLRRNCSGKKILVNDKGKAVIRLLPQSVLAIHSGAKL